MPHYRVFLNGQNFWLEFDQRRQRVGFYTTRFVEAADRRAAEAAAVGKLRTEGKLAPLNNPADPPRVVAEKIEEMAEGDIPAINPGITFYPDEEPLDS